MKIIFILLLMLLPYGAFAQQEEGDIPVVDVDGLLEALKNPFESKLPPPPPPVVSPAHDQNMTGDVAGSNGIGVPNLDGLEQIIEKPVEIAKPDVLLEGMVWSDKIQQVIIKGQILNVGDESNGLKLIKVSRDGATLQFKGKDFLFNIE